MSRTGGWLRTTSLGSISAAMLVLAAAPVAGQEQFQFMVAATDASGQPVAALTPQDVMMGENGKLNEILKVEPFRIPVKLTLAVDNGPLSVEALSHYRSGLAGLVKALDADVEVELITISPQPRRVVRATTDREAILRGIDVFGPQRDGSPRFTDALVEFSKRFQDEFDKSKRVDSIPVLVMLSTVSNDRSSYQDTEVLRALTFLRGRRAKVFVSINSPRGDVAAFSQINTIRQALIGIPATESTGGKFEALAMSDRLATLLPEWGEEIQRLHRTYNNQWVVTVKRQEGLKGPLQSPQVQLARPDIKGEISLDGLPPMAAQKQQ